MTGFSASLGWYSIDVDFTLFLQERFIDSGVNDIDYVEGVHIEDNSVSAAYYTDLRLSYNFQAGGNGDWEAFFHVTNLFDENPPVIPNFSVFTGTGLGANLSIHDLLGRRFVGGIRFEY